MHGGNIEFFAPRYGFRIDQMIDFSANINPLGPPPQTGDLLEQAWKEISRYPDPGYPQLRQALAKWQGIEPENLTFGNGATELIYWIARLFPTPKALVFAPTFSEYSVAVRSAGGAVRYEIAEEKNDFRHRFANPFDPEDIDLVFIGNPNNPTGNLYSKLALENWISVQLRRNPAAYFVIDESFLPFVQEEKEYSLIPFAIVHPQVLVLRSLTKVFSVPGLRLGHAVAHPNTVRQLEDLMPPWRINVLAQRFGEKVSTYSRFLKDSVAAAQAARENFTEELGQFTQLKVFSSAANFMLVKIVDEQMSASKLCELLAEKGILVRYCDDFFGLEADRFIRIAVRKPEENIHLLNALSLILGAKSNGE